METDSTNLVYEQKFGSSNRFARMYDLHARYKHIRDKTADYRKEWENFLSAYKRLPYVRKDKGRDANFGQFRFKIDNAVESFKRVVSDREFWAKLTPINAPDKTTQTKWSKLMSLCWHEEFIRPWVDGIIQTHWDIFNMQMFSAGVAHFENMGDIYPESIDTEDLFPDLNASVLPSQWELAFIKKRMTLTDLYEKSKEGNGWDEKAIKDLLDDKGGAVLDSLSPMEQMRAGTKEMNDTAQSVLVVIAYVREYSKNKKNGKVTKYVFPEDGVIVVEKDTFGNQKKEERYLCKVENYCKCISDVICIRTFHSFKRYWDGQGLAHSIYVACMQYDQTMNRAIRASLRKATMYFNSSNPDEQDKLRKMPDAEAIVLDPDTKIQQFTVSTELADLATTTRQLMFDTEKGTGESLSSGSQNVRNRAITAEEQRSNVLREAENKTSQLDIFVLQDTALVKNMVKRSLKVSSAEDEYKALERFKNKMALYGVPEDAYKYENLMVESAFSVFAGSIMGKLQMIDKLLAYTRIKPEHEGVENAARDGIASIVGYDSVDYYYPYQQKPDESDVRRAGVENEILDDPDLNPINVQVLATDNHLAHLEMHLRDAENDIQLAKELIEQYEQTPFSAKAVVLEKSHVRLRAVDNKLSHSEAHKQMLMVDPFMEEYVRSVDKGMSRIRAVQTDMQKLHVNNIESFVKDNQQNAFLTQEQQYKIAMMQQELAHQQAMNNIALGKAVEQATLRQATGEAKLEQSNRKFAQEMAQEQVEARLSLDAKIKQASVDLASKQQQQVQNEQTEVET